MSACPHTLHLIGTLEGGDDIVISVGVWVRPERPAFLDVPATSLHFLTIGCLVDTGTVRGVSSATFAPSASLTRGQAASMLQRSSRQRSRHVSPQADATGTRPT